ncbi:MAG: nicotinate-nucleotide adenylyltransferase [Aequorivita sp.]
MKKVILGFLFFGLTSQAFSQIIELPEIFIYPVNYKYIASVDTEDIDLNVLNVELKAATYNVTDKEYYSDEYDSYDVSFYIPQGYLAAAYDKDGHLLRTIEKYKSVKLPIAVSKAINQRFPNWIVASDVYKVTYSDEKIMAKKIYKMKLTNGNETIKIKTDEEGNFL